MAKQENLLQSLITLSEGQSIERTVARGVHQVLPDSESLSAAMQERKLKVYLGIDPTSPNLHLGHAVPLRKLREFQENGHEVVLLFGTFTGMIGDPTDKTAARTKLSPQQITQNVEDYQGQAGKILDLSPNNPNPASIEYNHKWLGSMNFADVVELAANFTVQQMQAREMFQERLKNNKPVYLHEFLYPLMQGQDSVAMNVDVEIGGKDQIFNMLIGRDLVHRYLDKDKHVVATKLIEDPNGKKMGKTEGNIVGLRDRPEVKYEAMMKWPDSAIPLGFELLSSALMELVTKAEQEVKADKLNPLDFKEALAQRVVSELDGETAAISAKSEFDRVYRQGRKPSQIGEIEIERGTVLAKALISIGLTANEDEAKRQIAARTVFVNDQVARASTTIDETSTIQIGKRTIKNIRIAKV